MGDGDHGHALAGELLHRFQDLADHLGIEGAGFGAGQVDALHSQRNERSLVSTLHQALS
jgi:hypothetical protein